MSVEAQWQAVAQHCMAEATPSGGAGDCLAALPTGASEQSACCGQISCLAGNICDKWGTEASERPA